MSPKDFPDRTALQPGRPSVRIGLLQKTDGLTFDEARPAVLTAKSMQKSFQETIGFATSRRADAGKTCFS